MTATNLTNKISGSPTVAVTHPTGGHPNRLGFRVSKLIHLPLMSLVKKLGQKVPMYATPRSAIIQELAAVAPKTAYL